MTDSPYVIVTRVTRPDGPDVVHVYGSYPTRSRAQSEKVKVEREYYNDPRSAGTSLIVTTHKIIDVTAMNEQLNSTRGS